MNFKEDIKPISYLKSNTAFVLDHLNTSRRPMIITQNGEARAVIQDAESYEKMKAAIGILKLLAQSERDIANGAVFDQEDVFADIEKTLFANK